MWYVKTVVIMDAVVAVVILVLLYHIGSGVSSGGCSGCSSLMYIDGSGGSSQTSRCSSGGCSGGIS